MAVADYVTYLGRLQTPIYAYEFRKSVTQAALGRPASLWLGVGSETGVAPTTHAQCSKATAGAVRFGGGAALRWAGMELSWENGGTLIAYDRLCAGAGLAGTLTSVQSLAAVALPRYTSGEGVRMAIEIYTTIGSTPQGVTVLYTNQAGVGGRTGLTRIGAGGQGGTNQAGQFVPIALEAGDTGVQSVESVQLAGDTGTAGNFGVTLYKPLIMMTVPGYPLMLAYQNSMFGGACNMPLIDQDACIAFLASTTSVAATGDIFMTMSFIDE